MVPDSYRHLTGDYYWDTDAVGQIRLGIALILTAVLPPIGGVLLGWYAVKALTTGTEE